MRTATGLTLVAFGAILAFAIRTSPSFLNLQAAGWVIMLTGVAGVFIPRRGPGRLRRRIVVRRPRPTAVAASSAPHALGIGRVFHRPAGRGTPVARHQPPVTASAAGQTIPSTGRPTGEMAEEFYQE